MTSESGFTVVVGIDGSSNSRAALDWAFEEASLRGGGTVTAVMAWTYAPTAAAGYGMGGFLPPADSMQAASEAALENVLEGVVPPAGVSFKQVVGEGAPSQLLIELSADANMIVVGKRGHGGFLGLLIGSVATQVANHATCPVVIVPSE
ncbi:MAG TPA: universal stress protein [Acidimicrobiaceae bacterium]|jgi:nucleotide-binding universal stress UspA family protein|nr:universal stress protein [Acidimicrobiaceae bacterium]